MNFPHGRSHKTSLTPPSFFIAVPVPSQARVPSCFCVLLLYILPMFILFFYWIFELFRRCGFVCLFLILLLTCYCSSNTHIK